MDQTEARQHAKRVGGIATQIGRLKGRYALPKEQWVVETVDGRIWTTVEEER